jgi:hypothetical protein
MGSDTAYDDSEGPAPRRSGMPVWAKGLIGCGVVLVVLIGACIAGGTLFMKNQFSAEWVDLRRTVDLLMTEEGARSLYASTPGLHDTWASEADFLAAADKWRPHLEPLPERIPLMSGRAGLNFEFSESSRRISIQYTNDRGARIKGTWKEAHLVGLDVVTD